MRLTIKYDINKAAKVVLQEKLDELKIEYELNGLGEVEVNGSFTREQYYALENAIKKYGIEIIENPKNVLVQKIKEVIIALVYSDSKLPDSKISAYIADRMNLSYSYIAKIFAEVTYTSIENYMILQRIERVKKLIIEEKLTCTEIAWKMNYSSVAHLSNQFKKTTGLSPTVFQRIIERRNNPVLPEE
ncbi:MAG TPA: AraC family transcriptional regulator [Bacteroidales bacterium]|nr:AraC family transcriptional regulator [Bacteroidales bacterium]